MDILVFLFFLSVFIFILALLFRVAMRFYIYHQLSKKFIVVPGPNSFSYQKLSLPTSFFTLTIQNLDFSVNFFGLISPKFVFLSINCDSVDIEFFQKPHHLRHHKPHTVSENIFIQVCLHTLILLIKQIMIRVKSITIRRKDVSFSISQLSFDYLMSNKKFSFELETQSLLISKKGILDVQFDPISFHPSFDADPVLSLINLEALAIPFGYSVPKIQIDINKKSLVIESINGSIILPRGKIESVTPKLKASLSISFPKFSIMMKDLSGFFSRHLFEIQNLNLDKNEISIKKIKIFNEDRPLIQVKDFSGVNNLNEVWNFNCPEFNFLYHTKTGLAIVPFLAQEIIPLFKSDFKKLTSIKLPTFTMNMASFLVNLKLTDLATATFKVSNILMENQKIKISNIQGFINDIKVLILKLIDIYVVESTSLEVDIDNLHFHGRNGMIIANSLMEALAAWRSIAPYILKHRIDTESLPFPIIVKCDTFNVRFHDSPLHQSISLANRILPGILSDSYVREFLLSKRAKELSMAEQVQNKSFEMLGQLKFKEFRNALENNKKHKYKFNLIFNQVCFSADSRNFSQKLKFIHQIDPTTKNYYPNIEWESMFGMNAELSFKKFQAFAFDIEDPIAFAHDVVFKGPTIIAEPRQKDFAEMHFTLDGENFTSTKNPIKLRLYSDMKISATDFQYHYGDSLMPVFQELSICIHSLVPNGIDPSARLVWWDGCRAFMRGQFLFKAQCFDARFLGTFNYRNLRDYMPFRFYNWQMFWREGDAVMKADRWFSPRVYKGVEGPISLDMTKLNWTFKFHWISTENFDPKNYIVFADVKKFGEKGYDTYKEFRSNEIVMDESNLTFSEMDGIVPNFTLDLAHFDWFCQPIFCFAATSHQKGQIKKKLGFPNFPRPPYKYFIEIKRHGYLRICANVFVFRIFDHFPISGSSHQKIQGSSVDLRLNEFQMLTHCDMTYECNKFKSSFKAQSISINATDLAHYASVDPRRTPSFIKMAPLEVEYGDQTAVNIEKITIHFNQFLLRYIQDFMKTTEEIRKRFSKPKQPFKEVSINDYPNKKVDLNVNEVQVQFVSFESELQAMGIIQKMNFSILEKEDPLNDPGTGFRIIMQELQLKINTQDPNITGKNPLLWAFEPVFFSACKCSTFSLTTVALNASPMDIAALNSIMDECFGEDKPSPTNPSALGIGNKNAPSESKLLLSIPTFKFSLRTASDYTSVDLNTLNANLHCCSDKTIELSVLINDGKIIDSSRDPAFRSVLVKWKSTQKAVMPLINIQLKMPPKISGAYIFAQVEVNIEPTIVCYDAKFWDELILSFKKQMEQRATYGGPFITFDEINPTMPFKTYDKSIFPETEGTSEELYNSTNKSIKIRTRSQNMQTMMMMRYFRLNPISMNVSYQNPDNKILSEIKNFQGQLHEIIYHDISVSITDLVEKLMNDIARDMIPQFIKHVVGIKRPDKTQDELIEEWLKSDGDKLSQTEKQKKLLFGPKTVKKK